MGKKLACKLQFFLERNRILVYTALILDYILIALSHCKQQILSTIMLKKVKLFNGNVRLQLATV